MCGLIGACGEIVVSHEKAIGTLLILDSLRGTDSTGVAVVARDGHVKMAKEVGHPFNLFDTKRFDKAFQGQQKVVIGHNRFATQGKVNAANAHPFDFTTVVGAHNGTLTSKWKLLDHQDFDVDSQNLYHHIDKKGIKDALENLAGAWALTWWDKETEEMNFLRNKERPLFMTRTKDAKVVFWASEKWMLEVALAKHNIEFQDIVLIDVDTWFTIGVDKQGKLSKIAATPAPSKYVPVETSYFNNKSGTWHNGVWTPSSPTTGCTGQAASGNVIQLPGTSLKEAAIAQAARETLKLPRKGNYANTKNVSLTLTSRATDHKGATYYTCFDDNSPGEPVRLYYHKKQDDYFIGEEITADIGCLSVDREGSYYKVVISSIKKQKTEENLFMNHKGHSIPLNEWISEHGTCEWCSDNILPTDKGFGLTTEGQCLCPACMSNHEIRDYVQLVN